MLVVLCCLWGAFSLQVLDKELACRLNQAGSVPARTPPSAGHARTQRTAAHQDQIMGMHLMRECFSPAKYLWAY